MHRHLSSVNDYLHESRGVIKLGWNSECQKGQDSRDRRALGLLASDHYNYRN